MGYRNQSLIALGLLLATFICWALASPVASSPDDDFHQASIWCSNEESSLCNPTGIDNFPYEVNAQLLNAQCFAHDNWVSAKCQSVIWNNNSFVQTDRVNSDGNYPEFYYWFTSRLITNDIPSSVLTIRFVNALLAVLTFTALILLLSPKRSKQLLLVLGVSLIPLGFFIISSINPSSWVFTAVIGLFFGVIAWRESASTKVKFLSLLLVAVSSFIGISARYDSIIYLGIALVAALFITSQIELKSRLRNYLVITGFSVLVISSLGYYFSDVLPLIRYAGVDVTSGRSSIGILGYNLIHLPELILGGFGLFGLGWLDTPMPSSVWVSVVAVISYLFINSLDFLSKRQLVALFFSVAALIAIPLVTLQFSGAHVGENVQPRYIFPLILVVLSISFTTNTEMKFSLLQQTIFIFLFAIAQSVALYVNILRYVAGLQTSVGFNLDSSTPIGWWWKYATIGPMWIWGIGTIAFTCFIYIVFVQTKNKSSALNYVQSEINTQI